MQNDFIDPPRAPLRFLRWFCPPHLHEGIEGDVLERFDNDIDAAMRQEGAVRARLLRKARWNILLNILSFFRPSIILRNRFSYEITFAMMLSNYFKVAVRNMMKRKLYSFINSLGLSLGIAFCILIFLYVRDERSFDQFHVNKDRIYRINEKSYNTWRKDLDTDYNHNAYLPLPLLQVLKDEIPEVEKGTHFNTGMGGSMQVEDKVFSEQFTFVDRDFFSMFSFPLMAGNPEKIFLTPNEVVITEKIEKKYFGDESGIGKEITIFINQERRFTVSGVIKDVPPNSSFVFDVLVPMESHPAYASQITQWGNFGYPTLVMLREGASRSEFEAKLKKIVDKYFKEETDRARKAYKVPDDVVLFELQTSSVPEIHLDSKIYWENVSDEKNSYILGSIALLILIIACINYISLSLTSSVGRRIEVGVRKVVGAQGNQLLSQFATESLLVAFVSLVFAIVLVVLVLPLFNNYTGKNLELTTVMMIYIVGAGLLISAVVGLLAGSYPSFFLSRYRPSEVLKGRFTSRLQAGFTKPLVLLQFALSAGLIICSLIMYQQMKFISERELGFDKENVLAIPTQAGWREESARVVEQMRTRLSREPFVVSVAGVTSSFNRGYSFNGYEIDGEQRSAYVYGADPFYLSTLKLKLVDGRDFNQDISSDTAALLVNEALVRDMGWKNPTQEYLRWRGDSLSKGDQIIGVLKDYHFLSLSQEIQPMLISINPRAVGFPTTILVRLQAGDSGEAIAKLEKIWKETYPNKPFEYSFIADDINNQYYEHKRWMGIMMLSTGMAILIACLGLFGLSGMHAINKTKEIGIRKVMGAALPELFLLLNRQYIFLGLISFAVATPLSLMLMNKWLEDFKYRITPGWELFVISMGCGMVVAVLTVSYHTIKAALTNPAETLKHE